MSRNGSEITEIAEIATRFFRHLASIERLFSQKIEEKESLQSPSEYNLGELVAYILNLKYRIAEAQNTSNEEELELAQNKLNELGKDGITKVIISKTEMHFSDDEYSFIIRSAMMRNAYDSYMENLIDKDYDLSQYKNSQVVSLVIGLEILISNLFKHYIEKVDTTNQIIKEKTLNFSDLKKFDSIDDARIFLQDQYIDNLLRSSFDGWLDEMQSKMKLNLRNDEHVKEDINLIIETLQRRHLIIHNDGIVNDYYIKKVASNLREGVIKGEELEISNFYLFERIKIIRKFGVILLYTYSSKVFKQNINEFFEVFNSIILGLIHKDCKGVQYFYRRSSELPLEYTNVLISKVNYFLSFKLNGDNSIDKEIKEFDINALSIEYKMAKSILLDNPDANTLTLQYFKNADDDFFISLLEWPLIKLLKQDKNTKSYIKRRINAIVKKEMTTNDEGN